MENLDGARYCEHCGTDLVRGVGAKSFVGLTIVGVVLGIVGWLVAGVLLAASAGSGSVFLRFLVPSVLLALATAVTLFWRKKRGATAGSAFLLGFLFAMLGGFAICTAMTSGA